MWKMASSSVRMPSGGIALVERLEKHVQPPERTGTVVHARGDLEPEDPLAGLAEGARGLIHQAGVDLGDLDQVLAQLRVGLGLGHLPRSFGVAANPVLHAQDDRLQPGVEILTARGIDPAVVMDLVQQPAPAQLQPNLQVLAEMLGGADAGQELVQVDLIAELVSAQVGIPVRLAVRHEVNHVTAGQRAERVEIDRVLFEQAAVVLAHRARAKEAAGGVVGLDGEALQQAVGDRHARGAHRLDDLTALRWRAGSSPNRRGPSSR